MENKIKKVIYKAPNGKLLRVQFALENGLIKNIKIRGDFFVHPEEAIFAIEKFLLNRNIANIKADLSKFLLEQAINVIGFTPKDLYSILAWEK